MRKKSELAIKLGYRACDMNKKTFVDGNIIAGEDFLLSIDKVVLWKLETATATTPSRQATSWAK